MRRREFIKAIAASVAAVPCSARAQQPGRTPLIAVLMAFNQSDTDGQRYAAVFRERSGKAGWNPGTDVTVEFRWNAIDAARARAGAAEIMALRPDLIVPHATIATRAVAEQTRAIPIVFTMFPTRSEKNLYRAFQIRAATSPDLPTSNLRWAASIWSF